MDYRHDKKRMNLHADRLSGLPNDLIHKIFSFLGLKHTVQTMVLSSRYRFIWTSMPYLNFSDKDFSSMSKFCKFVTSFLRCRRIVEVSSVKLDFRGKVMRGFLKKILDYAFSHNGQQMTVTNLLDKGMEFPLSLFSSRQSLKHLAFSGHCDRYIKVTSTWDLPALTALYLEYINFYDVVTEKRIDLLSKCPNLKNLTLKCCRISGGSDGVDISHPRISNLTLENRRFSENVLNIVVPELKDLTIRNWSGVRLLSAPKLVSLVLNGSRELQFSSKGLCCLEKADLCFDDTCYNKSDKECAHTIVGMLEQLHNAKFLTLNFGIIQLLSSSVELISHQPSPFKNLKSLKVYPHNTYSKVQETIPIEVKNYLLDSSVGATFTVVSCKEIIALRNAISAQNLMTELRVMLEQENDNTETSIAHMDEQQKAQPVEKKKLDIGEKMAEIKSCWNDLGVQIEKGKQKTSRIISKLREIEVLLLKPRELPTSKRDKLQACYSCLRVEVDAVVKKIIDRMKIQCDEKQTRLRRNLRKL